MVLVLWPGYSYSESITPYTGTTGNAAQGGLNWNMTDILPEPPGLDINGVIYNYTIRKNTDDQVDVYVQNERANGTGYIFREHDEWRPGSLDGTEINKVVPVVPQNRLSWGDGSIQVEGEGRVEDPTVIYSYTVDPCYDPQFSPNCPGYQRPEPPETPEVDYSYATDLTFVRTEDDEVDIDDVYEEEQDSEEAEQEESDEKEEMRLEAALAAADNSALFANALAQSQILAAMNMAVGMNSYYAADLPGGTYNDSVVLVDKQLPENKRGLRNGLAQQLLHEEMVQSQYNLK